MKLSKFLFAIQMILFSINCIILNSTHADWQYYASCLCVIGIGTCAYMRGVEDEKQDGW